MLPPNGRQPLENEKCDTPPSQRADTEKRAYQYLCIGEGYGSKTSCDPLRTRYTHVNIQLGRVGGVGFLKVHTKSEDAISHGVSLTAIHRHNILYNMIITIEK